MTETRRQTGETRQVLGGVLIILLLASAVVVVVLALTSLPNPTLSERRPPFTTPGENALVHALNEPFSITAQTSRHEGTCKFEGSVQTDYPFGVRVAAWSGGDAKCEADVLIDWGDGWELWGTTNDQEFIKGETPPLQAAFRFCDVTKFSEDNRDCEVNVLSGDYDPSVANGGG